MHSSDLPSINTDDCCSRRFVERVSAGYHLRLWHIEPLEVQLCVAKRVFIASQYPLKVRQRHLRLK